MNIAHRSANWFNFPAEHTCVARLAHTRKRSASALWSNFESNDASCLCIRTPRIADSSARTTDSEDLVGLFFQNSHYCGNSLELRAVHRSGISYRGDPERFSSATT
jgi:hypothetical protein